jgi:hypothetical protein
MDEKTKKRIKNYTAYIGYLILFTIISIPSLILHCVKYLSVGMLFVTGYLLKKLSERYDFNKITENLSTMEEEDDKASMAHIDNVIDFDKVLDSDAKKDE